MLILVIAVGLLLIAFVHAHIFLKTTLTLLRKLRVRAHSIGVLVMSGKGNPCFFLRPATTQLIIIIIIVVVVVIAGAHV